MVRHLFNTAETNQRFQNIFNLCYRTKSN